VAADGYYTSPRPPLAIHGQAGRQASKQASRQARRAGAIVGGGAHGAILRSQSRWWCRDKEHDYERGLTQCASHAHPLGTRRRRAHAKRVKIKENRGSPHGRVGKREVCGWGRFQAGSQAGDRDICVVSAACNMRVMEGARVGVWRCVAHISDPLSINPSPAAGARE
jgi:hypothetical protein